MSGKYKKISEMIPTYKEDELAKMRKAEYDLYEETENKNHRKCYPVRFASRDGNKYQKVNDAYATIINGGY